MARREPRCQVCRSPHRSQIDRCLANGRGAPEIARQFDVHKDAVWRHGKNHLPDERRAKLLANGTDLPFDLDQLKNDVAEGGLAKLVDVQARAYVKLDHVEQYGNTQDFVRLCGFILKTVRLGAQLVGELGSGGTVHNTLILTPEYADLRAGLVKALKPYPEAREAVAQVLHGVEESERPALEHAA